MGLEDSVEGDGWSLSIWDVCWKNFGMACWYQGGFGRHDSKDRFGVIVKSFVIHPNGMAWIESQFHPRKQDHIDYFPGNPVLAGSRSQCSLTHEISVHNVCFQP